VLGGSAENTKGGAGGKALTVDERSDVEAYTAMLISRLQEFLNDTPGLDDGLRAEVEVRVLSDGRLTGAKIVTSSKNQAFDQAILRAIRTIGMPARPKGLQEVLTIPFSTRAKD
jgi:TonB family protein